MNKQEFLTEINKLSTNFTSEQQALVQKMIEAFAPYEHAFESGELFAKKVKNKDAENPLHSFSIGIKERPLTFIRFTLNLDTNEVKKVHSTLRIETHSLDSLTTPDGSVTTYPSQQFISSIQEIEHW